MNERAVGVMLPRDLPAHQFRTYAQRAETLGFDELWVVEDCFFRGGIAQAAAALAMTERIRLGIGILPAAVAERGVHRDGGRRRSPSCSRAASTSASGTGCPAGCGRSARGRPAS